MRVVAVFSGGGAKAAAHVGAYRALDDWQLTPSHFVGTSIGAVIAASFASGLTYEEVLQRISTVSRRDVASLSPRALLGPFARSLLRDGPLRETIAMLAPVESFDELRVPLTVTAVDLESGDLVLFGAGGRTDVPLHDALYASTALPLFYPAAEIGDRRFADGGLRAVMPLDVAERFDPDLIFGVYVGPGFSDGDEATETPSPGLVESHVTALRILMAAQSAEVMSRWSQNGRENLVLVRPTVDTRATFAVENAIRYIEEGYRASYRALADRDRSR